MKQPEPWMGLKRTTDALPTAPHCAFSFRLVCLVESLAWKIGSQRIKKLLYLNKFVFLQFCAQLLMVLFQMNFFSLQKRKQDDKKPLEEKIKTLKKRNAELAAIARRLEEKAKHLQQENIKVPL